MLSYFNVELIRSVNASSTFLQHCSSSYNPPNHFRTETNPIRYRDSIITRSVICLIGLFTLCQIPASILNYIYLFYRNHPLLYICYDISNFLIFLNSAVSVASVRSICFISSAGEFLHFHVFQSEIPSRIVANVLLLDLASSLFSAGICSSVDETNEHSSPSGSVSSSRCNRLGIFFKLIFSFAFV